MENTMVLSLFLSSLLLFRIHPVHTQKTLTFPLIYHSSDTERRHGRHLRTGITTSDKLSTNGDEDNRRVETASLYQGYGTHYVDLWVGHPTPQRQSVIVDTGSRMTGFQCGKCLHCGLEGNPVPKLDHPYNHTLSDTFSFLKCPHCISGVCYKKKNICLMSTRYAEGSRWLAVESKDRVYYGGKHEAPIVEREIEDEWTSSLGAKTKDHKLQATDFAFPMSFGCQISVSGAFLKQRESGIMGMVNMKASFIHQMYDAKVIDERTFSLCLTSNKVTKQGGAMTMGGYNPKLHTTPLVYAKSPKNKDFKLSVFYRTRIKALYLWNGTNSDGDTEITLKSNITFFTNDANKKKTVERIDVSASDLDKHDTIVDSGTTSTYFPKEAKEPFLKAWKEWVGSDMNVKNRVGVTNVEKATHTFGFSLTKEQLLKLPTVLVQLDGDVGNERMDADTTPGLVGRVVDPENPHDVVVAIPPINYLIYDRVSNRFLSKIHFMDGMVRTSIVGANMMTGYDVVFDVDNQKVGFAQSKCSYDELAK